jgi:hypothetical protein
MLRIVCCLHYFVIFNKNLLLLRLVCCLHYFVIINKNLLLFCLVCCLYYFVIINKNLLFLRLVCCLYYCFVVFSKFSTYILTRYLKLTLITFEPNFCSLVFSPRPKFPPYSAWKSNFTAKTRSTSVQHSFLLNPLERCASLRTCVNHDSSEPRANSPIVLSHAMGVSRTTPNNILVVLLSNNIRINSKSNLSPIWVVARPKAWVCGLSLVGIVFESRPIHDVYRECYVLLGRMSLRRADHPSRGVLPSVVCLSVIVKPR